MPEKIDFFQYYKGVFKSIELYWKLYGGWSALYRSPYLHVAVLFSLLSIPLWKPNPDSTLAAWYDTAIAVLPNLLGFTLGGFAILLAFGNEKFLSKISGEDKDGSPSPYLNLCGSFAHFIIIQVVALFFAFFAQAWSMNSWYMSIFGLAFFYYAILTSVMATFAILNMSKWFDIFISINKNKTRNSHDDPE